MGGLQGHLKDQDTVHVCVVIQQLELWFSRSDLYICPDI